MSRSRAHVWGRLAVALCLLLVVLPAAHATGQGAPAARSANPTRAELFSAAAEALGGALEQVDVADLVEAERELAALAGDPQLDAAVGQRRAGLVAGAVGARCLAGGPADRRNKRTTHADFRAKGSRAPRAPLRPQTFQKGL